MTVHQVVHDATSGQLLADTMISHVFAFAGALIARFDIEE